MSTSQSDALVIFGVTGDLAHKMIFPALYAMVKRHNLKVPVIGVAFPNSSLTRLHNRIRDSIKRSGGVDNEQAFQRLLSLIQYVSGDYNDSGTFAAIKKALGKAQRPAHYLAIPPSLFETVIKGLGQRIWRRMHGSLSKSHLDGTWPLRSSSTVRREPCFPRTPSSASITSLARRRS